MTQAAVEEVRSLSRIVKISGTLRAVPDDADDDMIVDGGVTGNLTHIVTGDKHLLSMKNYQKIAIVKATEIITLISQTS